MNVDIMRYWLWFFKGSGAKPGYRRLINNWLILHLAIGCIISFVVNISLDEAAKTVLFPFAAIFIGLSFAWAVNAQALMLTREIGELSKHHPGGFVEYAYTYQTAILAILATLVLWGLGGLKIFDDFWPTGNTTILYYMVKSILFGLSSLSLRECWHVVYGTTWLLLIQRKIRENRESDSK